MTKSEKLVNIFQRLGSGEDPNKVKAENKEFLVTVAPVDIAVAQGKMIESGFSVGELYNFVSVYLGEELVPNQHNALRSKISPDHVLSYLMYEHDFAQGFLYDLEKISARIVNQNEIRDTSSDYRKLVYIAENLRNFRRHMDFEDDIILPRLGRDAKLDFFEHLKAEHIYLHIALQDLQRLVNNFDKMKLKDFKSRLMSICEYVCSIMREHLFLENYIIYPIIFEKITTEEAWDQLKEIRDDYGYSMFA